MQRVCLGLGARLALGAALVACAGPGDYPAATAGVRDSAGVRIVENAAPRWTAADAWRVADTALVSIGETSHDSAGYELADVVAVFRLSDGQVVIANAQTPELRFFDRGGRYVRTVGGPGPGPSEFGEGWGLVRLRGDTIVVNATGRLIFVSDTGALPRTVSVPRTLDLVGVFGDGRILLDRGEFVRVESDRAMRSLPPMTAAPRDDQGIPDEVCCWYSPLRMQFRHRLQVTDPDGKARQPYADLPGQMYSVVFGADGWLVVQGDQFYFAHSKDFDIGVYDADGKLERRVRRPWTRIAVENADVERYIASVRAEEQLSRNRGEIDRIVQQLQIADTMPAHRRILVDPDASLWVQTYRATDAQWGSARPRHALPRTWSVFDSVGVWLGELETPAGLDVREVGRDYVAGITRDEDDVERVLIYSLVKPR